MKINSIDHVVLTVKSIDETVRFYETVLGMKKTVFGNGRVGLSFGNQKFNLHELGKEFEPRAHNAVPGSSDLCLITDMELELAIQHVKGSGIEIIEGPVIKIGAMGPMLSFYFRDPDKNLIEISNYNAHNSPKDYL